MMEERGLSLPRKGQYGFALCFPGAYALGMAHLGFQSLIRLLSEASGWWGDRFFEDTGPRSLALGLRLSHFHLVAFSLSFELDIFPFLAMLRRGGVPLFSRERGDEDPFVLVGGPVVMLNPEIVAPFVDGAVIGEAEAVLPQILKTWSLLKAQGTSRKEIKAALASIPGVYVPELCTPVYEGDTIRTFEASCELSLPVRRQWGDLNAFETRTFVYTPFSHFQRTALVELNRGCRYHCRFCAGSRIYAPLRQRSFDLVLHMILALLAWQPEKIGLVGSDILSHPSLGEVIRFLIRSGKKVTLSSLVGKDLFGSVNLLWLLRQGGLETITLAPESGDPSFRLFLGKGLSNEEWLELVSECLKMGFTRVKLYFMLGKPRGDLLGADLEFLRRLVLRVKSPSRLWVSYSFLVPKPHTFLEDFEAVSFASWRKEKEAFERGLRTMGIPFSGESPRTAWVELILARGDRKLAANFPKLLENREFLSLPSWRKVLASLGRDEDEWPRLPWRNGIKPWGVVGLHTLRRELGGRHGSQCARENPACAGNHR